MEDAPLNKAHQESRNADRHLRYRRFNEAIECHQSAANYLQQSMQLTSSTKVFESLQCQYENHIRQQKAIRMKQTEYQNYLKAIENQRLKIANMILSHDVDNTYKLPTDSLQFAIFKTMTQADSLLGLLTNKDEPDHHVQRPAGDLKSDSSQVDETDSKIEESDNVQVQPQIGTKKPKGDEMVIEELKILNGQLHLLVSQLVSQLEHSNREIEALKDKITVLETEKLATACVMNISKMDINESVSGSKLVAPKIPKSHIDAKK